MRYVVIDTETTGLNPEKGDEIIEIAAVYIINDHIYQENAFSTLINPNKKIPKKITDITGITDDMVKGCPTIDKIIPQFIDYIGNSPLIFHNAPFDLAFINKALLNTGRNPLTNRIIDTLEISREVFDENVSHSLDAVAKRLNIDIKIDRHRALGDVILTAKVFIKLVKLL